MEQLGEDAEQYNSDTPGANQNAAGPVDLIVATHQQA